MSSTFVALLADPRLDWGALPAFGITVAVSLFVIAVARRFTLSRKERGGYRGQLALFFVVALCLLAILIAIPLEDQIRKETFSLVGIVLSAALALSSTTFLGNLIAGGMLRTVRHFDLGDWVRVGEHFGRVTERGLLHTEIQTADRDLTTLPNLLLATEPVKVVRRSGTIVGAKVGLGYGVPHARVEEELLRAASSIGLTDAFVAVEELGDFTVNYRVAGKLTEVDELISRRSKLRRAVLDALHEAGIEIMSPHVFTVQQSAGEPVIPEETGGAREAVAPPEAVAFDKADRAKTLAEVRTAIDELQTKLRETDGRLSELADEERGALDAERTRMEEELGRLRAQAEALEVEPPEA